MPEKSWYNNHAALRGKSLWAGKLETEVSLTEKRGIKIAAQNRKAYHDYFVEEKYEAGIELAGTEVKSIRAGTLNLKDAWCSIKDGELLVYQRWGAVGQRAAHFAV